MVRSAIAIGCVCLLPRTAGATDYEVNASDDLWGVLSSLVAGDTVTVHDGTFVRPGFVQVTWAGTEAAPILVTAADGERPILTGDASQNMLNLGGSWYTLRGFEIDGGSHGLRLMTSDHGTVEDLVIHATADVGISMNMPDADYAFMTIRHNEIYDTGGTGEAMYLGCNDSACRVHDSLIVWNYCHDMDTAQQGDGIELKQGSYANVIRDNVVVRTGYPGILVYDADGMGANVVEGNFVHTVVDNGMQIAAEAIVQNNVVMNAQGSAIASQPHQGAVPDDLVIVHNTLVNPGGTCMRTSGWDTAGSIVLANNAFYCDGGTALYHATGAGTSVVSSNVVVGDAPPEGTIAGRSSAEDFLDVAGWDLYPSADSPLLNSGDAAHSAPTDFNGTLRDDGMPDPGAYEWIGSANPGWIPEEGFREGTTAGGDSDADSDSDVDVDADVDADVDVDVDGDCDADADVGDPEGSGGCGCRASGSPPASFALFALALALLKPRAGRAGDRAGRPRRVA